MQGFCMRLIMLLILFAQLIPGANAVQPAKVNQKLLLESLIVTVNGERRKVQVPGELTMVSGDVLVLEGASLTDSTAKVGYINLVGYSPQDKPESSDDRKYKINTGKDLVIAWSAGKKGLSYRIIVGNGSNSVGEVTLRLIQPELRYASIEVNGTAKVLRPGEIAHFKMSDQFSVKEIVTNVEEDGRNVKYELVPVSVPIKLSKQIQFYEIRFLRHGKVFAQIPLQLEGQ